MSAWRSTTPTFETWTPLAAAHGMLQDVQEQLKLAEDGIAACPAELTNPRHHKIVNVLRTRELLTDVFGTGAVASASTPADGEPAARCPYLLADCRRPTREVPDQFRRRVGERSADPSPPHTR
ncbi:hypothetical protein [Streptomyces sp. GbtcB6]|uniref:hypothetical protein n=1 Tax=Streptomyces sp. GbtcB6 TaxID=2824751 RepID=UPI0020C71E63|nr:hypothetical protein [Streptomyces sp. GbtcB6]